MAELSAELKKLLGKTNLVVFPEDYVIVYLPVDVKGYAGEWFRPEITKFSVVIHEPKVITMVVSRRKWKAMEGVFDKYDVNGPFKVISFDVKLSLVASSYMCAIGSALTEANISANPVMSFKGDHMIVPKADLPRAVKILRELFDSCKKKPSSRRK